MGLMQQGIVKPFAIVHWSGKDVTAELSPYVKSLSYTDIMESKQTGTDTIALTLFNKDRRFFDSWYPKKGDILKAGIGWFDNNNQRHEWMWGEFAIDEVTFKLSPDDVIIGANAKPPVETRGKIDNEQSVVRENISLSNVGEQWAKDAGLTFMQAKGTPEFQFKRIEQRDESVPAFLARVSEQTSVPIAIKGKKLIMGNFKQNTLKIDTRNRSVVSSLQLPDSSRTKYAAVEVEGYDPQTDQTFSYRAGDASATGSRVKTLRNIDNVNSMADARSYAESYLTNGSDSKQGAKGRVGLIGTVVTTADVIEFSGLGQLHNKWKPTAITTSINGNQWSASAQLSRA